MSVARFFSLILAVCVLVLLAPLVLGVALGTRLSSPGQPLVRATGRRADGTHFSFVEFRTNFPNSDRPTEFGRFVRRHSLHRLPALVSLLSGEISLADFWQISRDPIA
jgi:putative colanic acid biosynthesis UDP-glucose lipid carrier transferase